MKTVNIHHGDSREVLKGFADNSIDSVVTDPPYALVSIVKRFGGKNAAAAKSEGASGVYKRASAGFMGKTWDTGETAFDPAFWAEVLRVLKPGGHIVAASGTRTYHRLACAIEDAGFEIRDMALWLYGSGFPKSHDVSKGIDKAKGLTREVIRERYTAKRIKPGATVVAEGGYGKQDVDFTATDTAPASAQAEAWSGWGTALKPACEPWVLGRKSLDGTVAANVLTHGTGALNIDACRIGADGGTRKAASADKSHTNSVGGFLNAKSGDLVEGLGRWPANVMHDGCAEVVDMFGDTAPSRIGKPRGAASGDGWGMTKTGAEYSDSGSAARFFYSAKADADDRMGSKHPTVKPIDLMRYLVRLITPPGGVVLDPFGGSGSTGVAAMLEGFDSHVIEREADYVEDIKRKVGFYRGEGGLSGQVKARAKPAPRNDDGGLFGLDGAA